MTFNPDNIQADCSEFLSYFLDKLHEELKDLYVPNEKKVDEILGGDSKSKDDQEWNETGAKN